MSGLNQLVMVLFLTFFMLLSDSSSRRSSSSSSERSRRRRPPCSVLEDIAGQIERFLMIQIFTSAARGAGHLGRAVEPGAAAGRAVGAGRGHFQFDPV